VAAQPPIPCTATKSRSDRLDRSEKESTMTSKKNRARAPKEINKKFKKKTSVLVTDKVDFIDYKDVNLLNRFVSDRSKIRNRRVTGNTVQQQRDIANAVKNAREMALLPYTKRVSQTRAGRPPRDRDEDGGGGGRRGDDSGGRRESFKADAAIPVVDAQLDDASVDVGDDDETVEA
jgi:small subunit ribosomal protein S18